MPPCTPADLELDDLAGRRDPGAGCDPERRELVGVATAAALHQRWQPPSHLGAEEAVQRVVTRRAQSRRTLLAQRQRLLRHPRCRGAGPGRIGKDVEVD